MMVLPLPLIASLGYHAWLEVHKIGTRLVSTAKPSSVLTKTPGLHRFIVGAISTRLYLSSLAAQQGSTFSNFPPQDAKR